MKTTRTSDNQAARYFAISSSLLIVVIVGLIFLFMYRNSERITLQNQQYLEDASLQSLKNMNELFENASNSISLVSHLYELQLTTAEFDYRLLDSMTEQTSFDHIRFVGLNGVSYSGDGSQVICLDREYYLEGIKGKSGVCYIDYSRFTNGSILIFYTPLYYDGEIIGVVNGVIEADTLSEQMESRYFGESAKEYLCLRDGTIVAAYGEETAAANVLTTARNTGSVTDQVYADLEEAFREGYSYSYLYSGSCGSSNAYLALMEDSDFMLLQTFPAAVTQTITGNANRDALKLETAMFITFVIYIALIIAYYIRRNRRLSREKEDLGQIVDSVKQLYRRFVVLNLDENTYEYLNEGDLSLRGLPAKGSYSDWMETFRRQYDEDSNYWGPMEDMTPEHLRNTLTRENWYSHREYAVPGERWERLSLIKLDMDSDTTSRILGAVEDITEIKRRDEESRKALKEAFEAADAASRAKSDFLSRMSHDIRTPMNAVIGLTAIMGAHLDDKDRLVDCLTKITSSSKHLLGLINEVLDMSKIESGKLVLSDAEFSLPTLVEDLLSIVQPMIKAKHQELTVRILDLEHEDVLGDSLRLQQVFVNILSNAVKYTNEYGHISFTVSEHPSKQSLLGEYDFVFEDDGIGMSPEFLEKLYSPFERAEDVRVSKTQGTGLGMTIAQNIIRLMGGTIEVESELGKGTRFTVHVPMRLQNVDPAAEERLMGLPVLVADDDQLACETTCLMLNELGMLGEWVLSGQEAVDHVRSNRERGEDYFAVILDWQMPGMDGVETARAIRQEVGPEVPIIILSAYDWSEIEAEAREAGVDAFIGKPLFKSRLRGVFVNFVNGAEAEAANILEVVREQDYTGKQVLLVEDNELNQEIAAEILKMTGLSIDIAENGAVAVERFQASEPGYYSMIFMDIQMPVMNGHEATQAIRKLPREDAGQIPIVAMTANTFSEDVHAAIDAGMDYHIAKPLDMNQLAAVLKKFLG